MRILSSYDLGVKIYQKGDLKGITRTRQFSNGIVINIDDVSQKISSEKTYSIRLFKIYQKGVLIYNKTKVLK